MVVVLAMVAPIHRTRNKSTGVDLFVDATYLAPRYRAAPSPLPAARYRTPRPEKTTRRAQALPPFAFALPFPSDRPLLRARKRPRLTPAPNATPLSSPLVHTTNTANTHLK